MYTARFACVDIISWNLSSFVDGHVLNCVDDLDVDALCQAVGILVCYFISTPISFVGMPTREDLWMQGIPEPARESKKSFPLIEEGFYTTIRSALDVFVVNVSCVSEG